MSRCSPEHIYGINKIKSVNPKAIIVFFSIMFSDYGKKYYIKDEKYNEFMQTSGEQGLAESGIQWSDF